MPFINSIHNYFLSFQICFKLRLFHCDLRKCVCNYWLNWIVYLIDLEKGYRCHVEPFMKSNLSQRSLPGLCQSFHTIASQSVIQQTIQRKWMMKIWNRFDLNYNNGWSWWLLHHLYIRSLLKIFLLCRSPFWKWKG